MAAVTEQLSDSDRGKAIRAEVPRSSHADWEPAVRLARSGGAARGAGEDEGARARADSVRPDARLCLYVLSRGGVHHGRGPGGSPEDRPRGSALRRRAPLELRRLCCAGPAARLQPQRLRRDASGSVRVGRQTARRELRGRGSRPRLQREAAPARSTSRSCAHTARRCRASLGWDARALVRPSGSGRHREDVARHRRPAKEFKRFERNVAKARAKDSLRAFEKLTEIVDGEARIVSDPPIVVPIEELVAPGETDQISDVMENGHRLLRAHAG